MSQPWEIGKIGIFGFQFPPLSAMMAIQ